MVYELTEMKKNLELQRLEKEDLLLTVEEKEKNLISKLEDLDQQKILLQDEEIKAIGLILFKSGGNTKENQVVLSEDGRIWIPIELRRQLQIEKGTTYDICKQ